MIQAVLECFALVFEAIGCALRLDPRAYYEVILHPEGAASVPGIVFLAGMSMLLGQSLILMATKLPDENRTYGEKTLDTIGQVLTEAGLLKHAPNQAEQP